MLLQQQKKRGRERERERERYKVVDLVVPSMVYFIVKKQIVDTVYITF
jgi:hypothetical protein